MKAACLMLLVLFFSAGAVRAQGDIAGTTRDRGGGVLPGAEIVAARGDAQYKAVTDRKGGYRLQRLPAGAYTVTASLAGFVTGRHEAVVVADGRTTQPVDFLMCLGALREVDWIVPRTLEEAWTHADVVARVRIVSTGSAHGDECPGFDFEDSAQVLELLKQDESRPVGRTLTIVQTRWLQEPAPYPVGQEMIVFLVRSERGFDRVGGPYWTFFINGNAVTSFHAPMNTAGVTPAALLDRLRAMAKSGSR